MEEVKQVKRTAKVDRGLADVRELVVASLDDNQPPTRTIVAKWHSNRKKDFLAAMEYLRWVHWDTFGEKVTEMEDIP